jgi:hypothetical protein
MLDVYRVDRVFGRGRMGEVLLFHRVYHVGWDVDLAVHPPAEDQASAT